MHIGLKSKVIYLFKYDIAMQILGRIVSYTEKLII